MGAIRADRRARLHSTFDLAADFAEADATDTRRDLVQQLTRIDLLVLEDFGMKKLGSNAAEDLLEVFVQRHEAASTLITTNRPTQATLHFALRKRLAFRTLHFAFARPHY